MTRAMRLLLLLATVMSVVALAKPPAAKPAAPPAPVGEEVDDAVEGEEAAPLPEGMTEGPAKVQVGTNAELTVPEGLVFGNAQVTKDLFEKSGNIPSGGEVGILLGETSQIVFTFQDIGYVKDDEKADLDADKMLASMKENQEEGNKERVSRGLDELEITEWAVKPHYDEATHNLESAPIVRNKKTGHQSVNYIIRILGRRGVMEVALLCSPERLEAEMPGFRSTMKGFVFSKGEDYMSWTKGDKVAEYGLAALVTGGAVAVAAKSGLLAKLFKPIIAGIVALGAGIKRLFGGKKSSSAVEEDKNRSV